MAFQYLVTSHVWASKEPLLNPRHAMPHASSRSRPWTPNLTGPPSRGPGGKPAAGDAAQPATTDGPSLDMSRGLAALIALNALIFAGAALAKLPPIAGLALYNANGAWWQVRRQASAD
jgi:hypothetical protein